MPSCSAALSSTTSSRFRRGLAYSVSRSIDFLEPLHGRRLVGERKGAARQPVPPILVQRHDLHRDVPRARILLELTENRPAQHIGQEYVERDGHRGEIARQRQRFRAAHRDQHLEARVARKIRHQPRIMRVVFDDKQGGVARPYRSSVIIDLGAGVLRTRARLRPHARSMLGSRLDLAWRRASPARAQGRHNAGADRG